MASSVNPLFSSSAAASNAAPPAASAPSSSTGLGSAAPTEGVFLQLLVSQLKNQDPLNPTDSTTFVTQLAQFSELEQAIAIRSDTDTLAGAVKNGAGSATPPTTPLTTPASGTNPTTTPATTNSPTTNPATNS